LVERVRRLPGHGANRLQTSIHRPTSFVILILQLVSGEAPAFGVPRPHILMFFCNTPDESQRGPIVGIVTL
jgi:hypothetical protein